MSRPSFVYVSYIAATPEKVWNALFDAELTRQYWGVHKNVSEWKVGATWAHQDAETGEAHVVGEVLEIDPPKRLVLSWRSSSAPAGDPPTRVTFEVQPFMDAVKLTVIHDDLEEGTPMWKGVTSGWPAILSSLKSLLETGRPLPMTTRRWGGPPPA
ncbi:MAG TPA: SRPBCC family protein [Polyangia bacterium]|nr:SRPBCC family protein [Polyangia bacterium]